MKKIITLLLQLVLLLPLWLSAQSYENSWINFSQDYFKIKIAQDGIYRLTNSTIIPLTSWKASRIQIFHDGVEQYIYIYDANQNDTISGADYIEFYGEKNKGTLDTRMYADSTWQPNPNVSLITDTSVYFITYSLSTPGKRMTLETDTSYAGFSPANYFIKDTYLEEAINYNVGGLNDQSIDYVNAEGWVGEIIGDGTSIQKTISTDYVYSSGPNVDVNTTVVGSNHNSHQLVITGPGGINHAEFFSEYQVRKYNFNIPPSSLTGSTSTFTYTSAKAPFNTDRMAFVNLSVRYPHTMNMEGTSAFKMYVPDAAGGKARMDMTNFNGSSIVMYDLTNHKRIKVTNNGSAFRALIPNDGNAKPKFCYITDSALVPKISSAAVSRINYVSTSGISQFNNLLSFAKDSAYIIITNSTLKNTVNAGYKDYRDQTTGNKVVLLDVAELYDQFAYGQRNHGLGIKNFIHFILDKWAVTHPPQAIFLIGKSIQPDLLRSAELFKNNPGLWSKCLVASYGYPTSDNLLAAGINGSVNEPVIPIGRLSAQTAADVTNYLQKVKQYDSVQAGPPQEWMKEVLHFGGGSNPAEQKVIQNYLKQLENTISDTSYGGHVTSYLKNNPNPIQLNLSKELQAKIDSGIAMMMFFGHASGQSFDISTDDPKNYKNTGKYPIVMASSCFAGNYHTDPAGGLSNSEQFVLEPQKAAIAFLASVALGDAYYLYKYDTALYNNISYRHYGAPIGKIIQQTIVSLQTAEPNIEAIKQTCSEMSLQGDPILKYNSWAQPDFVAEEKNISFTPSQVKSDIDTFSIHFVTRNYGKAVTDSFHVNITRSLPDGSDSNYTITRSRCYYGDTLTLTMKTSGVNGAGVNRFSIKVDLDSNRVSETEDFANNETTSSLFIYSSDIIPVYPPKYAIHPYSTVTLKASTSNPFGPTRTYRFEIDTAYFNDSPGTQSPLFRFGYVTTSGGVVTWTPPNYTLKDSTVYYWRVYDDTAKVFKNESSFIYIKNRTGWSQAHFYQFKNDGYVNVNADSAARQFRFGTNIRSLDITNYGVPNSATGFTLNNEVGEYGACTGTPSIHLVVIDSLTLDPWHTCNAFHGQANTLVDISGKCSSGLGTCRPRPENYFIYRCNDATQLQAMRGFIDSVPNGHYVFLYSVYSYPYSTCDPAFVNALSDLGFNPGFVQDNKPFIFYCKKGDPASLDKAIGTASNSLITMNKVLQTTWYRGNLISEVIGPAKQWTNLHWQEHQSEVGKTRDTISLSIYGYAQALNTWDTLLSGIRIVTLDTALSWISATQYPLLKLEAYMQDDSLRSPPQMDRWQIYYDGVPECALNPNRHFTFYNNPLSEGDTLQLSMAIDNIGDLPMDSLGVSFYMYDRQHIRHDLKTFKLDSLHVGQFLNADLRVDTTFGYAGQNSIWIEANPFGALHQPEQTHVNNIAEVKFNINPDVINPILDVTFDAVHILDGDIVSGKPHITIQLHDENKFLALNDTSNFRIYLKAPSQQLKQQLSFQSAVYSATMRFSPAVLPKNSCRIDFDPVLLEDGIYELEAEATDRSLNESGKYNYRIRFEVINKSTITEVLNYPNPFTTSTRFAFILTGNEVPAHIRIRIMTVTGKVIREITKEELGSIRIGRNLTDYGWDGRDEYGDRVANGVYLYRVDTDLKNGDKIERRETEVDKYFKKGWGKMYLMR